VKAIVLYGPGGHYGYEPEWKNPELQPGFAIVKVAYCGVCGSDLPRFSSTGSYHHPMILGHEFSGTVEIPAQGSDKFRKGQPVAVLPIIPCGKCGGCLSKGPFHCTDYQFIGSRNDGGFAEYCAVPECNLFPLASKDILKAGSLIEPMAVGLHAVRRSGFEPGKTAIVFGAGPIGLITGFWLRIFSAGRVVIADIRERNIEMAKKLGFEVVNPAKTDVLTLGKIEYAFEAAGSGRALNDAIGLLEDRGVLTVIGRDVKDTVIPLKSFETLMRKELDLKGCWGYDMRGEWEFVADALAGNTQFAETLVTHTVGLEQAVQIIKDMCDKKIEYCKVIIAL
jgi:L-iditol 2-dehydrogenase